MTPSYVTPDQIAQVSGLTEKHVRRMVSRALVLDPDDDTRWFGQRLDVVIGDCGLAVAFSTLPTHIREAFIMLDQLDLPLPPPVSILFLNAPARPTLH